MSYFYFFRFQGGVLCAQKQPDLKSIHVERVCRYLDYNKDKAVEVKRNGKNLVGAFTSLIFPQAVFSSTFPIHNRVHYGSDISCPDLLYWGSGFDCSGSSPQDFSSHHGQIV